MRTVIILIGIIAVALSVIGVLYRNLQSTKDALNKTKANFKAAAIRTTNRITKSGLKVQDSRELQLALSEVKSLYNEKERLSNLLKEAEIKERNVKSISTVSTKLDTTYISRFIRGRDTCLTLSNTQTYLRICLGRDTIRTNLKISDTVSLISHFKKELVNAPRKTIVGKFLQNIFGRKHKVGITTVVHSNKNIITEDQRIIFVVP